MSLSNRELWACANEVVRQHGDRAPMFVAERIGAMVLAGDVAGIDAWKAVAGPHSYCFAGIGRRSTKGFSGVN